MNIDSSLLSDGCGSGEFSKRQSITGTNTYSIAVGPRIKNCHSKNVIQKCIWKLFRQNVVHFVQFDKDATVLQLLGNFRMEYDSILNIPRLWITVTPLWGRWHLKTPASRMFSQPLTQAHIKGNIKALRHHWSLAFVMGIYYLWPVDSLHEGPVTRKMLSFDNFIMLCIQPFRKLANEDFFFCLFVFIWHALCLHMFVHTRRTIKHSL